MACLRGELIKSYNAQTCTTTYIAYNYPRWVFLLMKFIQFLLLILSLINCFFSFEPMVVNSWQGLAYNNPTTFQRGVSGIVFGSHTADQILNLIYHYYQQLYILFTIATLRTYKMINTTDELFAIKAYFLRLDLEHYLMYFGVLFAVLLFRRQMLTIEKLIINRQDRLVEYHVTNHNNIPVYPPLIESLDVTIQQPLRTNDELKQNQTNQQQQQQQTLIEQKISNIQCFIHEHITLSTVRYVLCIASRKTLAFPSLSHTSQQLDVLYQQHKLQRSPGTTQYNDPIGEVLDMYINGYQSKTMGKISPPQKNATQHEIKTYHKHFIKDNNIHIYPLFHELYMKHDELLELYKELKGLLS